MGIRINAAAVAIVAGLVIKGIHAHEEGQKAYDLARPPEHAAANYLATEFQRCRTEAATTQAVILCQNGVKQDYLDRQREAERAQSQAVGDDLRDWPWRTP
jgi:hypothetical protein